MYYARGGGKPALLKAFSRIGLSKSPILNNFLPHKQLAFTLAEVLITLAIVGIVAALTIPTLVTKIQKHIYYNQFMKARSVIENALRLHAGDHDCPMDEPLCNPDEGDAVVSFSKYFKGAQLITDDNAQDICKGYDKLPISWDYINVERERDDDNGMCGERAGDAPAYSNNYEGFITMDGLLLIMNGDWGMGCGSIVDINGPDVGPNILGRDVFDVYLDACQYEYFCGNRWGMTKGCIERNNYDSVAYPCDNSGWGENCGARLIEEGKMTY